MKRITCFVLFSVAIWANAIEAGLTLTMDYTAFDAGPSGSATTILQNDAWDGTTSEMTRLNAAKAVMDEAAQDIQNPLLGLFHD